MVLLHQHAEELAPGGALAMIADGCLDGVDVVFGTHLTSRAPTGTYLYAKGYAMAAADAFEIKIQGKGGHGASPHETIDAVAIGAQLVNQLQYSSVPWKKRQSLFPSRRCKITNTTTTTGVCEAWKKTFWK